MRKFVLAAIAVMLLVGLCACQSPTATPTPKPTAAPAKPTTVPATTAPTAVPATVAPTTAATTAPAASTGTAALTVKGKVTTVLSLTMDQFKALGTTKITAEHPKKGKLDYEGVFFKTLFEKAGIKSDAKDLVFTASDGYEITVALADVTKCDQCMVALQDGGGLTTAMPGMPSNTWAKNLVSIEAK